MSTRAINAVQHYLQALRMIKRLEVPACEFVSLRSGIRPYRTEGLEKEVVVHTLHAQMLERQTSVTYKESSESVMLAIRS